MAQVTYSAGIDHVSGALAKPGKSGQHSCEKMLLATHRVAAHHAAQPERAAGPSTFHLGIRDDRGT